MDARNLQAAAEAALDDETRQRIANERETSISRVLVRVHLRLDRAESLLASAAKVNTAAREIEKMLVRADRAARSAQTLLAVQARRAPPRSNEWSENPGALFIRARSLRVRIAHAHAVREVAAGRFAYGARLARRALALDPGHADSREVLVQAQRGQARRGVLQGSPPPPPK